MLSSISFSTMNGSEFAALAGEKLKFDPKSHVGDFLLNPEFEHWVVSKGSKPAAVLIPVVERAEGLSVILTKRAEKLKSHSGQISFPGGKVDAGDASVEVTALREAHEEIDLGPDEVMVIARLPDYYTGSGFKISPIVGLVDANAMIKANPDEVDYIFEVPLSFLMDEQNHKKGSRIYEGKKRFYFEMPYKEHYIWGVTAGIINVLSDRLKKLNE